jgi:hypothetical protein
MMAIFYLFEQKIASPMHYAVSPLETVFGRYSVRISTELPTILRYFGGSSKFLQENVGLP